MEEYKKQENINATNLAMMPICRLLNYKIGENRLKYKVVERDFIGIGTGINKYKLYLDLVRSDYVLDMGDYPSNTDIATHMYKLTSYIKLLFDGVQKTIDCNYKLRMDTEKKTIFIDEADNYRIGIRLEQM